MSEPTRVYKIVSRQAWTEAQVRGVFDGAAIDLQDGYIHLSTAAQAAETARLHFRGQTALVVVEFDVATVGPLTWEPSRGGQLFPHLYGKLDPAAAVAVHDAPLGEDGAPQLPALTA